MDHDTFDALTRALDSASGTRRTLMRLLVGGAVGAVTRRLGLSDAARAAETHHPAPTHSHRHRPGPTASPAHAAHPRPAARTSKKHNHRPATPPIAGFVCPPAARCKLVAEDRATGAIEFAACEAGDDAKDLCASAAKSANFRALANHLHDSGFALDDQSRSALDLYRVQQDGTPREDVLVFRFHHRKRGETVLLRYGRAPSGTQSSTYAFVQRDDIPATLLAVGAHRSVTTTSVAELPGAGENKATSGRTSGRRGVRAAANPDNPYDGQAKDLCQQCPVVCKTLGSMECSLLVLLLSRGNAAAAAILGPLCSKPAEAGCGPYCQSMIAPALEDDPQNCGACGHTCDGQQLCCSGLCVDQYRDPGNCGGCGHRCQDGACEGGRCQRRCPEGQDTCCADGERQCPDGTCVASSACCFTEKRCNDGTCIDRDACCPGEKRCSDGTCIAPNECCSDVPTPICDPCEATVCRDGVRVCEATDICGRKCGEGYCPVDATRCLGNDGDFEGVCCGTTGCRCASGYQGGVGCNGKCCRHGCNGSGCIPG
ncbi:MAG: hypothetical protein U0031_22775 [Thermomicrobiales bacterium]